MQGIDNLSWEAVLKNVVPTSAKAELRHKSSCYLGVSLETRSFRRPMLDATVNWIDSNFKRCAVVVGDSLHRYTLQLTRGLSAGEAASEAYTIGTSFLIENQHLFAEVEQCSFEFFRVSDLQKTPECVGYENQLAEIFSKEDDFARSIKRSALSFIDRRRADIRQSALTRDEMINLSCRYILEEMAIFSCLVEAGWEIEVYPGGELPVLVDIARGKYPAVPKQLKRRINIELRIRAKGR
jgi:tRNA-dependent cyclodipeptide synthase